jgi:hypothetical protein
LFASGSRKRSHIGFSQIFGVLTLLDKQMSRAFVRRVANKSAILTLRHFLGRYAKTPYRAAPHKRGAKRGDKRRTLDVTTCFPALLRWCCALMPETCHTLALAMDASTLGQRIEG